MDNYNTKTYLSFLVYKDIYAIALGTVLCDENVFF